jgi:hypothetical protein
MYCTINRYPNWIISLNVYVYHALKKFVSVKDKIVEEGEFLKILAKIDVGIILKNITQGVKNSAWKVV